MRDPISISSLGIWKWHPSKLRRDPCISRPSSLPSKGRCKLSECSDSPKQQSRHLIRTSPVCDVSPRVRITQDSYASPRVRSHRTAVDARAWILHGRLDAGGCLLRFSICLENVCVSVRSPLLPSRTLLRAVRAQTCTPVVCCTVPCWGSSSSSNGTPAFVHVATVAWEHASMLLYVRAALLLRLALIWMDLTGALIA